MYNGGLSYCCSRLLCHDFCGGMQRRGSSSWHQQYSITPATVSGSESQLWPLTRLKSTYVRQDLDQCNEAQGREQGGVTLVSLPRTPAVFTRRRAWLYIPIRVYSPNSPSSRCCFKDVEVHCMYSRQVRAPLRWTCVENSAGKLCHLRLF